MIVDKYQKIDKFVDVYIHMNIMNNKIYVFIKLLIMNSHLIAQTL